MGLWLIELPRSGDQEASRAAGPSSRWKTFCGFLWGSVQATAFHRELWNPVARQEGILCGWGKRVAGCRSSFPLSEPCFWAAALENGGQQPFTREQTLCLRGTHSQRRLLAESSGTGPLLSWDNVHGRTPFRLYVHLPLASAVASAMTKMNKRPQQDSFEWYISENNPPPCRVWYIGLESGLLIGRRLTFKGFFWYRVSLRSPWVT